MKSRRKKNRYMLLLILLLGVTLGYAAVNTTLKITGTTLIKKQIWNIYWTNVQVNQESTNPSVVPVISNDGDSVNTKLTWTATLNIPGDFYEFTVDAVNAGSVDAMITGITPSVSPALPVDPAYIKYEVKYADGVTPAVNQLLPKGDTSTTPITPTVEKYKIRVYYDENVATAASMNSITSDTTYTFNLDITYGQATDDAYQRATTFQNDSWDIIKTNVLANTENYPVGATKTIEMDLDNDNTPETYTLRVVNNTYPPECGGNDFSQTACGFVVEFQDVITKYRINYDDGNHVTGSGGTGSWKYCDMRAYLNNGIYAYLDLDHADDGIYGHLPSDLKNKIIPTKVISPHNIVDTENFESEDMLYLLSSIEIWGSRADPGSVFYETLSETQTRQLDYYRINKVTLTNYSAVIKKYRNQTSNWWLRSVQADTGWWNYLYADKNGGLNRGPTGSDGVSPAFRLA